MENGLAHQCLVSRLIVDRRPLTIDRFGRHAHRVGRRTQLAKQTGVDGGSTSRNVAAVVHVVGAFHTFLLPLHHQVVAVERGQQQHRHEDRQHDPRRNPASLSDLHFACKVTNKSEEYKTNRKVFVFILERE